MLKQLEIKVPCSKSEEQWFKEFNYLNQGSPSASPSPAPCKDPTEDRRRQHPRFDLDDAQAALFEGGLLAAIGVGKHNLARALLDLSEGGVRMLLHRRIKTGSKVKIRLEIERHGDAIETQGVVRWCFESGTMPGTFYAGVMFTKLNASQKKKITLMRDWFTSPQFRALRALRRRKMDTSSELSFPK